MRLMQPLPVPCPAHLIPDATGPNTDAFHDAYRQAMAHHAVFVAIEFEARQQWNVKADTLTAGPGHTVEDTVYLSPGCTGRGIGSALLGTLLAGCAAAGARQVIAVIADTGSDASAALHRRFGFTQAGCLSGVGRKHGRWIDTVLMQKDLGPSR